MRKDIDNSFIPEKRSKEALLIEFPQEEDIQATEYPYIVWEPISTELHSFYFRNELERALQKHRILTSMYEGLLKQLAESEEKDICVDAKDPNSLMYLLKMRKWHIEVSKGHLLLLNQKIKESTDVEKTTKEKMFITSENSIINNKENKPAENTKKNKDINKEQKTSKQMGFGW